MDLLFVCAVCGRDVKDYRGRKGPDAQIAPVCRYCERSYTERVGKPKTGAFMDRRKAMQVMALSEALHSQARQIEWSAKYDRA